jgi:hypothetical protein
MPTPRRGRRKFQATSNIPQGPARLTKAPPKQQLANIYKAFSSPQVGMRVSALYEALRWWDGAMQVYMTQTPLDANRAKSLIQANKARTLGLSASTPDESETAMAQCIRLYEKLFNQSSPSIKEAYERFKDTRDRLALKEHAWVDRFKVVLEPLNEAFKVFGKKFVITQQTASGGREFDGDNTIFLPQALAKSLLLKMKQEGVLAVLFSEAFTVVKSFGFEKDVATDTHVPNLERMLDAVPIMLDAVLQYCNVAPARHVFKQYLGSLEAINEVVATLRPNPTLAAAKVPRPQRFRVGGKQAGGPRVGIFLPGSAMALLYTALEDGAWHSIAKVLAPLPVSNPMGRLKSMESLGKQNGLWHVDINMPDKVRMIVKQP